MQNFFKTMGVICPMLTFLCASAFGQAGELIISEYAEGSSNNKYVEIYNGTGATVDLTDYALRTAVNGQAYSNNLSLSGNLPDGETLVVANTSSVPDILAEADLTWGSATWNGDDAVGLEKNGVIIDAVGEPNNDPGTAWNVAGVTNATQNGKLIRKPSVCEPNTDWNASRGTNENDSEWIYSAYSDDVNTIGTHDANCAPAVDPSDGASDLIISEYAEGSSFNKYVEIYNGTGATVDLSAYALRTAVNGQEYGNSLALSGELADGETFSVANNNSNSDILAVVDLTWTQAQWNGDDAIGLEKNGVIIDALGEPGNDPGTGWNVAGINNATVNGKLIRKPSVCEPNTDWNASRGTNESDSEWIYSAYSDDANTIGTHDANCAPVVDPSDGASDLIISEYAEGSSFNKYVEIYNGTGATVDLSAYALRTAVNGQEYVNSLALSGELADGETFSVANNNSNSDILAVVDLTWTQAQWNGDDAIGLEKNGVIIDALGEPGNDPGTGWNVAGINNATVDGKLIRKPSVCDPNTDWNISRGTDESDSEWIYTSYSADVATIGSHTANCSGDTPAPEPPVVDLGPDQEFCPEGFPITLDAGNADADEFVWNSGETTQTININDFGIYEVTVTKDGLSGSDAVTITEACGCGDGGPTLNGTTFRLDFESEGGYTTSTPEFSDGSTDFFTRTDGSNISGGYQVNNPQGNFYFAAQDIDGEGASLPVSLDFDANIASYTDLNFKILLAEEDDGSNEDWDASDYMRITYSIDGGPTQNLLWVQNDGSTFNSAPLVDTDFDGIGDGTEITNSFQEFVVAIPETGNSISVNIEFNLNSGDEDIAIDDIRIEGTPSVPEPFYTENFETEGGYTTSTPEFAETDGDFFTRTDGSNIGSYNVSGKEGEFYFAAQDIDANGASLPASMSIENINIAGYSDLGFRVLLAEEDDGSSQDWDSSDYVRFFYRIDGGPLQNLLWIQNDGSSFNSAPFIDTDFDGVGDCQEITDTFQEFYAPISESGSFLEIFVEISLNSGDEDIALDNIRIEGIFQGGGEDEEAPVANCIAPGTLDVALDENGAASIQAADIDDVSTDNVGIASLEIDRTSFTCADLGPQDVILTATDLAGNSSSCTTTVNVVDNVNPQLNIEGVIEVSLDENGQFVPTQESLGATATDICGDVDITISTEGEALDCADVTTETNFANDLIISTYVEGSSFNKYVEIYNGTGASIDLANYELRLYANGADESTTASNLGAAGTLANGSVAVFRNGQAGIYDGLSFVLPAINFNGDDALVLYNITSETQVDIFGSIGQDPGSQWSVDGRTTQNQTLVRESFVIDGNTSNATDFPSLGEEWIALEEDEISVLGSHTNDATGGTPVTVTATDPSGNTTSQDVLLIISDDISPVAIAQNVTVQLDNSGIGYTTAEAVDDASSDACGIETLALSQTDFDCSDVGTNNVTLTVTDVNGNVSTAGAVVTVLAPVDEVEVEISSSVAPNSSDNIVIFDDAPSALDLPDATTLTASIAPSSYSVATYQWFVRDLPDGTFTAIAGEDQADLYIESSGDSHREYLVEMTTTSGCFANDSAIVFSVSTSCKGPNKVQICHVPPGNPDNARNICVNQNAVPALLANSDSYIGSCDLDYKMNEVEEEEEVLLQVSVYPNPTQNNFNLSLEGGNIKADFVQIFDMQGRLIQSINVAEYENAIQMEIDMSKHDNGIYILNVIGDSHILSSKKVVKTM